MKTGIKQTQLFEGPNDEDYFMMPSTVNDNFTQKQPKPKVSLTVVRFFQSHCQFPNISRSKSEILETPARTIFSSSSAAILRIRSVTPAAPFKASAYA